MGNVELSSDGHWTFSKGDLMAIDMGRLKNKESNLLPIIWEREMLQEEFCRNPRSLSARSWISCISTRTWSNWRSLHPVGQGHAEKFDSSNDGRWVFSVQENGGSLSVSLEIGSMRDRSDFNEFTPSSPRVWRRATRADSFLVISAMASIIFFIQHILVAVERFLVELITTNNKDRNWAHVQSSR